MQSSEQTESPSVNGPAPGSRRPPPSAQSLIRRYKWSDLTEAERDGVQDCLGLAATRGGIGLGATLTIAGIAFNLRGGRAPLPASLRYGSVLFFSVAGTYLGFISGGPLYAKRILSVPNSRLADDLRTVIGDWKARDVVPEVEATPNEPLPDGVPGTGRGQNEIIPRDPKDVRAEQRHTKTKQAMNTSTWTERIGLTNRSDIR